MEFRINLGGIWFGWEGEFGWEGVGVISSGSCFELELFNVGVALGGNWSYLRRESELPEDGALVKVSLSGSCLCWSLEVRWVGVGLCEWLPMNDFSSIDVTLGKVDLTGRCLWYKLP